MNRAELFWQRIKEADTIAIGGHIRPDGDCVGSVMGLYHAIHWLYQDKKVTVYLGEFSPSFLFIKDLSDMVLCPDREAVEQAVSKAPVYDLFIALDTSSEERLEFSAIMRNARSTICVDHHVTNTGYVQDNLVFDSSSASEAVYDLLMSKYQAVRLSEIEKNECTSNLSVAAFSSDRAPALPKEVAEALYLGIVHDTGVFKHSNTTRHTMEAAGHLISCGVNTSAVIDDTFYRKTYAQNLILGRALLESRRYEENRVIETCVPRSYFTMYQIKKPDLDGIVDQLRITEGVEVAIFAYETEDKDYKFSFRSNTYVDVSRVAMTFDGGGHIRAAGCTLKAPYEQALEQVLEEIKKQL